MILRQAQYKYFIARALSYINLLFLRKHLAGIVPTHAAVIFSTAMLFSEKVPLFSIVFHRGRFPHDMIEQLNLPYSSFSHSLSIR